MIINQLIHSLHSYMPSDMIEHKYLLECKKLLTSGPDALSSTFFSPGHFTASAFVISPDQRSLLMMMHHKIKRWLQPGGHIEPSDTSLLAAVQREVQEETGIDDTELLLHGILDIDIHEIKASSKAPTHLHYDIRYLLRANSDTFTTTPEAPQIEWVDLETAATQFTESSLARPIGKIRGMISSMPG